MKRQCREIWLQRIGNEKLLELDDQSLHSHRICDSHFEDICREANGRLKSLSLPTLHLPGYEKKENDSFFLPSPEEKKILTPEKIKERMHILESSTFQTTESSPVGSVMVPRKVYTRKKRFSEGSKNSDIDIGSKKPAYVEKLFLEEPSTSWYQSVSSTILPKKAVKLAGVSKQSCSERILLRQLYLLKRAAKKTKVSLSTTRQKLKFLEKINLI